MPSSNDRPFSADSAWNTPISVDATYAPDGKIDDYRTGLSSWLSPDGSSIPVFDAKATDPVERVLYNPDTWVKVRNKEWAHTGNSPEVEAKILASSQEKFPFPYHPYVSQSGTSFVVPKDYDPITNPPSGARTAYFPTGVHPTLNPDGNMAVYQPDGKVFESLGTIVLSDGTIVAQTYKITDPTLKGDGWQNGTSASMTPIYAGVIHQEEFQKGEIDHAIKIVVPAQFLDDNFVYPALSFDRGALVETPPYSGQMPMGTRLAIPHNVDIDSLGLTTALGKMVASTAQEYGMIIADRGGPGVTMMVEADVTDPTLDKWALSPDTDLQKILKAMQVVTSNPAQPTDPTPTEPPPPPVPTLFTLPVSAPYTSAKYGGSGNDTLTGTTSNDYLSGRGGADKMSGGLGDDLYSVDTQTDVVIENQNAGIDTVSHWGTTWTLAANVENITYYGAYSHTVTANGLNNLIRLSADASSSAIDRANGGAGNDIIVSGANKSEMTGGTGTDIFQFEKGARVQKVMDFKHGEDLLDVRGVMTGATASLQSQNPFTTGVLKLVADGTGVDLLFDADGSGSGVGYEVLHLVGVQSGSTVTQPDFVWH